MNTEPEKKPPDALDLLLDAMGQVAMFIVVYIFADLCWIGAEYLFEGAVHSSKVDGYVLALLSYCIVKDLNRLQDKLVERRKEE